MTQTSIGKLGLIITTLDSSYNFHRLFIIKLQANFPHQKFKAKTVIENDIIITIPFQHL